MFIAILTLLSALSISGVAIFYSVIGLATIFPGAFWPVVIMGSVLEVGKLITASWLYRHWKQTRFLLKTYRILRDCCKISRTLFDDFMDFRLS